MSANILRNSIHSPTSTPLCPHQALAPCSAPIPRAPPNPIIFAATVVEAPSSEYSGKDGMWKWWWCIWSFSVSRCKRTSSGWKSCVTICDNLAFTMFGEFKDEGPIMLNSSTLALRERYQQSQVLFCTFPFQNWQMPLQSRCKSTNLLDLGRHLVREGVRRKKRF